jgi:hypothetical protein
MKSVWKSSSSQKGRCVFARGDARGQANASEVGAGDVPLAGVLTTHRSEQRLER